MARRLGFVVLVAVMATVGWLVIDQLYELPLPVGQMFTATKKIGALGGDLLPDSAALSSQVGQAVIKDVHADAAQSLKEDLKASFEGSDIVPFPLTPEGRSVLWRHLRSYVLPHRLRVGPLSQLTVLGGELPGVEQEYLAQAVPPGAPVSDIWLPKTKGTQVFLGCCCGKTGELLEKFNTVGKEGVILAIPICTPQEADDTHVMLYNVNCDRTAMGANHQPRYAEASCKARPGPKLTCDNYGAKRLHRVSFLRGWYLLEKRDSDEGLAELRAGDFVDIAMSIKPVTTDKVTAHKYQEMYERYLPIRRNQYGSMLEIGLGCVQDYGPGKSAILWRRYFRAWNVEFIEKNRKCVAVWSQRYIGLVDGVNLTFDSLNFTLHFGDQIEASYNISEQTKAPRFDIIVDDGGHYNKQIRETFKNLWPTLKRSGYYVMEDMAAAAFSYADCEPIMSAYQKQTKTTVARVAEIAQAVVLRREQEDLGVDFIECQLQICLFRARD